MWLFADLINSILRIKALHRMFPCSALRGMQKLIAQRQYLTNQGHITPKTWIVSIIWVCSFNCCSEPLQNVWGNKGETGGGGGYLFHGNKGANAKFSGEQGNKDIIVEWRTCKNLFLTLRNRGTSQFNLREQVPPGSTSTPLHNNDTWKYCS